MKWNCKASRKQNQWNSVIYLCQGFSEEEKKKFQVSDMGESTDGKAMCSDIGEKIGIFVHIQFANFQENPKKSCSR